jgi:hypothetical protein
VDRPIEAAKAPIISIDLTLDSSDRLFIRDGTIGVFLDLPIASSGGI